MKKNFTLQRFFLKKENWLITAMFTLLFVFGCYEYSTIKQPTEGTTNSSFNVQLVVKEDADPSNDWTYEDGSLTDFGLFGVLIPEGWSVTDNIAVRVESSDSISDGLGGWKYPTTDHSGDYILAYNLEQSTKLLDSVGAPPGYNWWGAVTTTGVDMAFFDSLHFSITVMTDDKVGEFYLQYTIGDMDYAGRIPVHYKSDPLPITITSNVGVNRMLNEASLSVYPNPSYGYLNIELGNYNNETVSMLIYDLKGRSVRSGLIKSAQTTLDIVDLDPGVYVIRLDSGEETITRKFVKN